MDPPQAPQSVSSSSSSPSSSPSSPSDHPIDGQRLSESTIVSPTIGKPKREYDSKKRIEAYSGMNKPAYQAVKVAAADSLLRHLSYPETPDQVWLRDTPKPDSRLDKTADERPYYWTVMGNMTPREEKGWNSTIGKGRTGPSQTGSRWGTENLHILEGMLKSNRVRPFFGTSVTHSASGPRLARPPRSILGLGWGLMGDHEDPSRYDKDKYAAMGITLFRDLPDAEDSKVPGWSGDPKDEDSEGEDDNDKDETSKSRE